MNGQKPNWADPSERLQKEHKKKVEIEEETNEQKKNYDGLKNKQMAWTISFGSIRMEE